MKFLIRIKFILIGLLILFFFSCTHRVYQMVYPTLNDGKYDTEFPYKSCSQELKEITASVRKVFCTAHYKNYIFRRDQKITRSQLNQKVLKQAEHELYFTRTVSGTGAVIFNDGQKMAILSCAHIFIKPDTIITYFADSHLEEPRIIQSVAIKEKQNNLVTRVPERGDFKLFLIDREKDIVLLTKEFSRPLQTSVPALKYPFGKARELEWGSFVYLIGFPKGYKVVTKGIVSNPDWDKRGSFLIDALFNKGMSGGILLAIRDGVPNFEIVGITTSAAAEDATVLVPENRVQNYDETVPYDGPIYVENKKTISYGITRAIPSEAIVELLSRNSTVLKEKGFDFSNIVQNN